MFNERFNLVCGQHSRAGDKTRPAVGLGSRQLKIQESRQAAIEESEIEKSKGVRCTYSADGRLADIAQQSIEQRPFTCIESSVVIERFEFR